MVYLGKLKEMFQKYKKRYFPTFTFDLLTSFNY